MSTSGDVQFIGGYRDTCGGMFSTLGDTMSTSGDIMSTSGDVQYIGGCSVHRGMFSTLEFSIEIERIYQVAPPHVS